MSARVEAAAKAIAKLQAQEPARVVFSEAAIERAARHFYTEFEAQPIYDEVTETFTGHRLWEWLTPESQERYRSQIRAVVAALREGA